MMSTTSASSQLVLRVLLFFLGALIALLVERRNPEVAAELTLPVASGVVAGGSLMGVALVFWANGGRILSKLFGL